MDPEGTVLMEISQTDTNTAWYHFQWNLKFFLKKESQTLTRSSKGRVGWDRKRLVRGYKSSSVR